MYFETTTIESQVNVANTIGRNNSSANLGSQGLNDHLARDIFVLVLYGVTGVLAVFGNYVVCKIIFSKNSKLKNSTNILVGNLAISDIIGGVTIPGQWLFCSWYALENLYYMEFACAVTKSMQVLSFYMSSLTMMLIAFERYLAIMHPLRRPMESKLVITITWIVTVLFVASSIGSAKIFEYFAPDRLITCRIVLKFDFPFNSDKMRTQRVWGIWMGQYFIPLAVTGIVYFMILRKIWNRGGVGSTSQKAADARDAQKRKVVIMLIIVVVVFAVCWFPLHALNFVDYVIKKLEKKAPRQKGPQTGKIPCNDSTTYFLLYWLGTSSCCYNPFIYWWMNPEFRRGYLKVFPSFIRRHLKSEENSSEVNETELRSQKTTESTNPSSTSN